MAVHNFRVDGLQGHSPVWRLETAFHIQTQTRAGGTGPAGHLPPVILCYEANVEEIEN